MTDSNRTTSGPPDRSSCPVTGRAAVAQIDTPEGVLRLLDAAAGPTEPAELARESAAVAVFLAHSPPEHSPRHRASRRVRIGAIAVAMSLVLGGGMAAADLLPAPAQRWVAAALGRIGIDVPAPPRPSRPTSAVLTPENQGDVVTPAGQLRGTEPGQVVPPIAPSGATTPPAGEPGSLSEPTDVSQRASTADSAQQPPGSSAGSRPGSSPPQHPSNQSARSHGSNGSSPSPGKSQQRAATGRETAPSVGSKSQAQQSEGSQAKVTGGPPTGRTDQ
jgi:hypothetical protein